MECGNGYVDSPCLQSLADFDSTPAIVGHFVHCGYYKTPADFGYLQHDLPCCYMLATFVSLT